MKKQAGSVLAISSLVVMLAVAPARAGSSTRIEADVPFDFMVAGKTLPAGTYSITEEKTGVLRIRSMEHRSSAAVLADVVQGRTRNNAAVLVFNRYGHRCFLAEAWFGVGGGFELSKSRNELELRNVKPEGRAKNLRQPESIVIAAR
jgi:hypothetical protein